jgi:hypothetical protein
MMLGSIFNSGGHSRISSGAGAGILICCGIATLTGWKICRPSTERHNNDHGRLSAQITKLSSQIGCGSEGCPQDLVGPFVRNRETEHDPAIRRWEVSCPPTVSCAECQRPGLQHDP